MILNFKILFEKSLFQKKSFSFPKLSYIQKSFQKNRIIFEKKMAIIIIKIQIYLFKWHSLKTQIIFSLCNF